jgi:hypothetical protein
VTHETDREADASAEQADGFAALCEKMMKQMAGCGPMMERMTARCMATSKAEDDSTEDPEQSDD